jgi:hypothetical protein
MKEVLISTRDWGWEVFHNTTFEHEPGVDDGAKRDQKTIKIVHKTYRKWWWSSDCDGGVEKSSMGAEDDVFLDDFEV